MTTLQSLPERLCKRFFGRPPIIFLATAFVVLVCLSLVSVEAWLTWRAREIQLEESEISASNLAQSVAQHAYDTLKESDTILVGLVERLEKDEVSPDTFQRLHELLVHRVAELPQLHGIFVFGPDGEMRGNAQPTIPKGMNNADREYFIFHRDHHDRHAHVGPPIRSKTTGDWVLTVSRRIDRLDGSFGGVALATINIRYFQKYYDRFNVGQAGAILLANDSGIILMRRPFDEKILGRDISRLPLFHDYLSKSTVGTAIFKSRQDGVIRLNSYRRVEQFPLVVSAALSKDEILAGWRADAYLHGAAVGILVIGLGLAGWWLVQQIGLRIQAEAELVRARNALETLNQTLEELAMQDGLTGLANRRQFDVSLKDEFSRAMRNASSLALIMIDVDCFKQYNDIYGHAAGDDCLRAIGKVVGNGKKRPGDVTARYGGEELVVLLPATDVAGAMVVAEKIRQAIHDLELTHAGSALGMVTISAGVHAFEPVRNEYSAIDLVKAADKALYLAKAAGRNQVYTPPHPPYGDLEPLTS